MMFHAVRLFPLRRTAWAVLAFAVVGAFVAPARAESILPYGVRNDVSYETVVNGWGWTVAYRDDYTATVSIADLFANATGTHVMLAAIQDGSLRFDILAAAPLAEVRTHTLLNQTHQVNGAEWYYNGLSMGFAGAGDTIIQESGDTGGSGAGNEYGNVDENDRLSWETGVGTLNDFTWSPASEPTILFPGVRSGSLHDKSVNDGSWDRVILTANNPVSIVPLPAAAWGGMALMGLLGASRLRRRRANAYV